MCLYMHSQSKRGSGVKHNPLINIELDHVVPDEFNTPTTMDFRCNLGFRTGYQNNCKKHFKEVSESAVRFGKTFCCMWSWPK